ncbi:MAG: alpha/beta hydrolase [Ginsengibacter sp.]
MPLLLFHGGFGSIHDFQKVIPELAKHFRVIAIDSPSEGRSGQTDTLCYQLLADYYSEFIDKMRLDSVYVIGWSDGGNSALLLAYGRPDKIKKVIISGTNSDTDGYAPGGTESIGSWNLQTAKTDFKDWVADYIQRSPQKGNWEQTFWNLKKMWLTKLVISNDKLGLIKSKFLIVLGDNDFITLEHGITLYHKIKGSEFCVLPNTTHQVFKERPELINNIGIDFFAGK